MRCSSWLVAPKVWLNDCPPLFCCLCIELVIITKYLLLYDLLLLVLGLRLTSGAYEESDNNESMDEDVEEPSDDDGTTGEDDDELEEADDVEVMLRAKLEELQQQKLFLIERQQDTAFIDQHINQINDFMLEHLQELDDLRVVNSSNNSNSGPSSTALVNFSDSAKRRAAEVLEFADEANDGEADDTTLFAPLLKRGRRFVSARRG